MAVLVLGLLFLALSGVSDASWCVCRSDVSESALQKALDYACGAGADCAPIHQGSPCYQPNNVKAHCSYAANSYFQRKGQATGSCEFNGAATVTGSDPSGGGCTYPASSGAAGTGTSTTNAPPGSTTSTIAPPGTGTGTSTGTGTGFTSPNTPTTGIMGGGFGGSGLGPSGTGINPDPNDGGFTLLQSSTAKLLLVLCLWFSSPVFWWG